jgi:hypothetical protein
MPVIGDTLLTVVLPSGNRALYSVGPQYVTPSASNVTQNENAYMYGRQIAVELDGDWYRSGLSEKITDLKTLALIDRAPQADTIPGGRYA